MGWGENPGSHEHWGGWGCAGLCFAPVMGRIRAQMAADSDPGIVFTVGSHGRVFRAG